MKVLLIAIIVIILAIFGYNTYADYQRFSLENYKYEAVAIADVKDADQTKLMLYHNKIAQLNGHVITQWSANHIDVRNPEDDDQATLAARATYDRLLGEVTYIEQQLKAATPAVDPEVQVKQQKHDRMKELFTTTPNNDLRIGSKGALVYELQKLLNTKGTTIPVDGNF